ncbi:MAG TPA: glycosyltransferase family 1 protein [Solirubrobacteraceae bacterium]|jgi:glycosyltransferase involved in cell wall biosynthesis
MRVGLDLLYLVPGQTGGRETYARELVPAMLRHDPALELVAFVNRDAGPHLAAELGSRVRAVTLPVSARSRAQWALGELALVSVAASRARVDVLHSMANFAPPFGRFRRVVTIHDLQYRAIPELLSPANRLATSALVSLAARRASRIVAVSSAGADEIAAGLRIARARVDVVPNGVRLPPAAAAPVAATPTPAATPTTAAGAGLAPSPSSAPSLPSPSDNLLARLRPDARPLALAVATNLPHKNLPALIDALALIAPTERPLLAIAGHGTDDGRLQAQATAAGVGADVRLLGHCSTAELDSLYTLAACLVLPTLHEGFGLPVIEAMARSLPVACSDIPALREVGGAAALYFDPRSPSQIAAAISELIADTGLAGRLRELGRAQAGRFSWSAAAAGTLACYRRALESPQ